MTGSLAERFASANPIRSVRAHCCACTTEGGSACHHIGPALLCGGHAEPEARSSQLDIPETPPSWRHP